MAANERNDAAVLTLAMGAYESSRLRLALGFAACLAVVPALSAALGTEWVSVVVLGTFVCATSGALVCRGGAHAFSAMTGLKAGLIPLALAHVANRIGHVCTPSGCTNLCVPACAAGGVLAGALVAFVAKDASRPGLVRLAGGAVACAVGALGCSCVGYSGIAGLVLGMLASSAVGAVALRRATERT